MTCNMCRDESGGPGQHGNRAGVRHCMRGATEMQPRLLTLKRCTSLRNNLQVVFRDEEEMYGALAQNDRSLAVCCTSLLEIETLKSAKTQQEHSS